MGSWDTRVTTTRMHLLCAKVKDSNYSTFLAERLISPYVPLIEQCT